MEQTVFKYEKKWYSTSVTFAKFKGMYPKIIESEFYKLVGKEMPKKKEVKLNIKSKKD